MKCARVRVAVPAPVPGHTASSVSWQEARANVRPFQSAKYNKQSLAKVSILGMVYLFYMFAD